MEEARGREKIRFIYFQFTELKVFERKKIPHPCYTSSSH